VAASYAVAYPDRIDRLLLLSPAPPARGAVGADLGRAIAARTDTAWLARALRAAAAEQDPLQRCRATLRLGFLSYFADTTAMRRMRGVWCDGPGDVLADGTRTRELTFRAVGAWDLTSSVGAIRAPTLVIHGSDDVVPLAGARQWIKAIPSARLLVLAHTGHFPWLEAPGPFFAAADNFLRGGWPEGAASQ
jgi:proline iminopeptidase